MNLYSDNRIANLPHLLLQNTAQPNHRDPAAPPGGHSTNYRAKRPFCSGLLAWLLEKVTRDQSLLVVKEESRSCTREKVRR